ncbi:unnamed protein product [Linum trigynum]|uniref:Uncharacterized protein n=1 Tax=Linum trigynum TaxID=586398 RepID=A0AAV2G845_9ROSI
MTPFRVPRPPRKPPRWHRFADPQLLQPQAPLPRRERLLRRDPSVDLLPPPTPPFSLSESNLDGLIPSEIVNLTFRNCKSDQAIDSSVTRSPAEFRTSPVTSPDSKSCICPTTSCTEESPMGVRRNWSDEASSGTKGYADPVR